MCKFSSFTALQLIFGRHGEILTGHSLILSDYITRHHSPNTKKYFHNDKYRNIKDFKS